MCVMTKFTPKNRIQELAYTKRQIKSAAEFSRSISGKDWKVKHATAYHWWENGIPEHMYISSARNLAKYFDVTLDELLGDGER